MANLEMALNANGIKPFAEGKVNLMEVNWLAAKAGVSWQEALDFVRRRFSSK